MDATIAAVPLEAGGIGGFPLVNNLLCWSPKWLWQEFKHHSQSATLW